MTDELKPIEYECMKLGCEFVGTPTECAEHQSDNPDHNNFQSVPSWAKLAGEDPS